MVDDLTEQDWDEGLEGECRRNPPCVGRFRGEDEHLQYDYGQWPLVQAVNWCGAFEPCRRALSLNDGLTRTLGPDRVVDSKVADDPNPSPRPAADQQDIATTEET
ncbi:MAG: hypothetical protein HUU26_00550 [Gemmatimonadaceae bacterium]|nr:hypothetical protein [Gemmatimonadaceae bacterium]